MPGSCHRNQIADLTADAFINIVSNGVLRLRIFHFSQIDHLILSHNQHIDLRTKDAFLRIALAIP